MTSFRGNVFGAAKYDEMLRGYEIGAGRERVTLLGVRVAGPLPPAVFLRSMWRARSQSTLAHCAPRPGPLKLGGPRTELEGRGRSKGAPQSRLTALSNSF